MRAPLYKYQSFFLHGFIIATVLSVINAILVVKFELYGGEDHGFALVFPFIIFGPILMCFNLYLGYFILRGMRFGRDSEYVKEKYPAIWHRANPVLGGWTNPFFSHKFIRDHYDDGTDERLNRIKQEIKDNHNIGGGGFLMMLGVEIFSIFLHLLSLSQTSSP